MSLEGLPDVGLQFYDTAHGIFSQQRRHGWELKCIWYNTYQTFWAESWMLSTPVIIHANQSPQRHMMAAQGMHFGVI